MRIVIVNDDGIYSPGIRALAERARQFGEVRIVAPDVEQSSMGHAITHSRPLQYRVAEVGDFKAFKVNGTPADCVALGCHHWEKVDVVLSGINLGPNLGNSMWHSGTLAAAKQASLLGIRGIALSLRGTYEPEDFKRIAPHVDEVLELVLRKHTFKLLNINFPASPCGIRWTRQSVRQYDGAVIPSEDPFHRPIYWCTVTPLESAEEGTDRRAVDEGFISITPLRLDLTDHDELARVTMR
ncbi:5'/3'-nucleotidase SurE [Phragmitibacter flavus]|uniref:5'-nucleotidase SurE n=1 Tax=Phragmitibacter flavus TaxID=2576071 RepID=A0A5R8K7T1_9BACT|nr:5'/3'-nucleotidase SurE [Phragmitibacter flavus]TLD68390.1 5'/3'-nucleotidase SurE [Phragmitibacter flavus]